MGIRSCEHVATLLLAWHERPEAFVNGRHRYHPGTTKAKNNSYSRQANVTPEAAEVEWHLAATCRYPVISAIAIDGMCIAAPG